MALAIGPQRTSTPGQRDRQTLQEALELAGAADDSMAVVHLAGGHSARGVEHSVVDALTKRMDHSAFLKAMKACFWNPVRAVLKENISMVGLIMATLPGGTSGGAVMVTDLDADPLMIDMSDTRIHISLSWRCLYTLVVLIMTTACVVYRWASKQRQELGKKKDADEPPPKEHAVLYVTPGGKRAHLYRSCETIAHVQESDVKVYPVCYYCKAKAKKRATMERDP